MRTHPEVNVNPIVIEITKSRVRKNDFFREESNKDSIFDFISSKTFPYMRNCILIGPFHGEYNREENLTSMIPEEVIIPSGELKK